MHLSLRSPQEGGSSAPLGEGEPAPLETAVPTALPGFGASSRVSLGPHCSGLLVLCEREQPPASVSGSSCLGVPTAPHRAGQSARGQHASSIYRWLKGSGSFIMFQHKFDGTSAPRGQVWVWPTLPSLRSCSWPIPRWAPEDPQEGKRLELPKPVSVFTGRALTSLHRHPAVLPGLLAPCLQPLPAGESSGCPCPCVTQALTPHPRCPLGPWEPSGDSGEGAGSWANTMLTSLTAPGVIALPPSAQAFWGGLLHAHPIPGTPFSSWVALGQPYRAKPVVRHAWRAPGLSQCGKVLCLFWNNWTPITVDSKGSP